ncbi:MAG: FHA domain-containing protein [Candidatus Cryptobacteroides sp.]
MRLVLQAGFFGRRGGIWPELGSCPYVSGNHGVIGGGPSGWTITDSGSMNGTRVNGMKLTPGTPVTLKAGDTVRIATLDFKVE